MFRVIFPRVMWVGRATVFLVGLAVILALIFGVASAAFGANGDNFILGVLTNKATDTTRLSGNVSGGPALQVINSETDVGSRGLQLNVAENKPPIQVNANAGKATNLNADMLDGEDSGKFVQNTGETTFSVFDSWVSSHPPSSPVTVDYRGYWTTFTRGAGGPTQSEVRLTPPLPSSLYGKSMRLTGMEICYDTSDAAVALSRVELKRYSSTSVGGAGGSHVIDDDEPADGSQCHMYDGTPQLMGTNSFAFLEIHVNWSETTSNTTFTIQRTTFFLKPSNTAAAAL